MSDKLTARRGFAAARRERPDGERSADRAAIRSHVLDRRAVEGWVCVAGYESLPTEPGSPELLAALHAAGCRVLVPVTLPDRDLEWREWPDGGPLGRGAISDADAVLVPAFAVARDGTRLGRGGGSYDRALPRCRAGAPLVALLFEDELVASLPRDEWDVPVTAAVRPSGWSDLPRAGLD